MREEPVRPLWQLTVMVVGLILSLIGSVQIEAQTTSGTDKPVVRFLLFFGETCPHCHEVMDNYLPEIYEKYGDQVEYQYIEVWSDVDSYLTLLGLETKLGVPQERQGSVPVLIIGDKVLVGSREIPDMLETYIDEYLAKGGVDYPSLDDLPEVVLPTPEPTVQILLFFDPSHPDRSKLNDLIVRLGQEHGSQLQAYVADLSDPESVNILEQIDAALGVQPSSGDTPQVLIGRQMLVGFQEIEQQLPGLVVTYIAQGGLGLPSLEELMAAPPSQTASPVPETPEPVQEPIYLAYFEQAGCQECARTTYDLRVVQDQYPQMVVESFSMEEADSKALNEWLSDRYGVPEEKRLSTPMIFVGDNVLIGTDATLNNLLAVVGSYAQTGAERTWEDFDAAEAEKNLVDRFKSFGVLTVLGAGLLDGLNPCAFATLVFFISYLAFSGRSGRDILLVGMAFALGVFLTYLLVGLGLLKVVQSLSFFTALGRWVYLITALLCTVLAVLTFRDFFRVREGQATDMTLKLPISLRRRIHKVIREGSQVRAFVAVALVTGFVVSLLELACTGQVYLPTIMFVMSVPELAAQAFLYLALYCLMFILPLIVVFVLSYYGTTSEQLGRFINRHTGTIKLATGLLFVGLALWMTWTLAPLFGIYAPWNWVLMSGVLVAIALVVAVLLVTEKQPPAKQVSRRRRSRA